MKFIKPGVVSLFMTVLAFAFGCNNGVNSPTSLDEGVDAALNSTSSALNTELANAQEAGINIEDVDALFSIGWRSFSPAMSEEEEMKSKVFAVAPNADSTMRPRLRSGSDMGQVVLSYPDGSAELNKSEKRNGGIFYSLGGRKGRGRFGDEGSDDEAVNIPFVAGGTYTFEATGTESFPAVSVDITAAEAIVITSHEDDAQIDSSAALDLSWTGGVADQPIVISIRPARERVEGQDPADSGFRNGRGSGRGQGGRGRGRGHGMGPEGRNGRFHGARFMLESNPGAFTISAEEIGNLLANENVTGLRVAVTQIQKVETEQDGATYAIHLRTGDSVKLQVAN